MKALKLTLGINQPTKTKEEEKTAIEILKTTVEKYLPEFVKMIENSNETTFITMHQDSFAAGYDIDEYTLLGMAVKYVGLFKRQILFVGTNHETF